MSNEKSKRNLFSEDIKMHFISSFFSLSHPIPNFFFIRLTQWAHWILKDTHTVSSFNPDIPVFHLCSVIPIIAPSSSGVTPDWAGRRRIKTVLWLNRSIRKTLQVTEILSPATIIFNEASLLLESWQKTVIYSSPRAMTANWANIKITCNVKSACAYHYTRKAWCAGKEACQAIVFVNEKNSFIPKQSTVSDLIEQVLTKRCA